MKKRKVKGSHPVFYAKNVDGNRWHKPRRILLWRIVEVPYPTGCKYELINRTFFKIGTTYWLDEPDAEKLTKKLPTDLRIYTGHAWQDYAFSFKKLPADFVEVGIQWFKVGIQWFKYPQVAAAVAELRLRKLKQDISRIKRRIKTKQK